MKYTRFNNRPHEIHTMVYDLIAQNSNVLDIGCASGYFAKALQRKHCKVTGIDIDREAVMKAKKYCIKAFVANLDTGDRKRIPKEKYDSILLLDVIEHMKHFDELLSVLKKNLSGEGKIVISTPNIAHLAIRLHLLTGHFDYTEYGILDREHIHFFTRKTLMNTVEKEGFSISSISPSSDFGQIPLVGGLLRHIPKTIQWRITNMFPTLLGVQWLVVVTL